MATNCPQQVKPRAWRSALCLRTVDSNSRREKSCRICENMLHTRFKAEPPKSVIGFWRNSISTYQRLSFFRISSQIRNLDKSDYMYMPIEVLKTCKRLVTMVTCLILRELRSVTRLVPVGDGW